MSFARLSFSWLSALWRAFRNDLRMLRRLFTGFRGRTFLRTAVSPVSLTCVAVFAFALVMCWIVSARTARNKSVEVLRAAAQDMRNTLDSSVDLMLFYQGNAICRHYKSPENMSSEVVHDVMRRYGIDELNVVDARGIVVIGALAEIGYDMGSKPQTAAFNCLLRGAKMYSQPFRGAVENPRLRRKYVGIAFPPPAKGYVQIGFSEERLRDDVDYWFADQANDWHIGETGFYVIAKEGTGVIDSCGCEDAAGRSVLKGGETLADIGFDMESAPSDPAEVFHATLCGRDCLCLSEVRLYHRVIAAIPMSEVTGSSRRVVFATALVLLMLLILVIAFTTRLSDLVAKLQGYISAEKERQIRDLSLAKTIQTSALPLVFPSEPDYSVFARMVTAREVGGDFYDFSLRADGKLVFLIADVSGKGVPAALFMMRAKAILRAATYEYPDSVSAAVANANDSLADHNDAEMFVTAWVGVYDRTTGEIDFVNAGHNPPLVRRADGSVEWIRGKGGLALAVVPGLPYRSGRCRLGKGDSLFLYTDGVTEAMSVTNEQFGEARLEAALAKAGRDCVTEVGAEIAAFTAGAERSDDITMLVLDRLIGEE